MDHTEAVRLKAAEKYVLRELTPTQMEEYEEHFFDCAQCMLDIKFATAFADASREHFRKHPVNEEELIPVQAPATGRWFRWPKLAFAFGVPVFAALLLFVGYQTLRTTKSIPQVANSPSQVPLLVASTQGSGESFQLHGIARGAQTEENADRVAIHSGQSFDLKFDFIPAHTFSQYIGQLQDEAGRRVLEVSLSGDLANKEVHVPVSAGALPAGKYKLVIAGDPAATGKFQPNNETARYTFTVAILP
jgi:hypothetical protein